MLRTSAPCVISFNLSVAEDVIDMPLTYVSVQLSFKLPKARGRPKTIKLSIIKAGLGGFRHTRRWPCRVRWILLTTLTATAAPCSMCQTATAKATTVASLVPSLSYCQTQCTATGKALWHQTTSG